MVFDTLSIIHSLHFFLVESELESEHRISLTAVSRVDGQVNRSKGACADPATLLPPKGEVGETRDGSSGCGSSRMLPICSSSSRPCSMGRHRMQPGSGERPWSCAVWRWSRADGSVMSSCQGRPSEQRTTLLCRVVFSAMRWADAVDAGEGPPKRLAVRRDTPRPWGSRSSRSPAESASGRAARRDAGRPESLARESMPPPDSPRSGLASSSRSPESRRPAERPWAWSCRAPCWSSAGALAVPAHARSLHPAPRSKTPSWPWLASHPTHLDPPVGTSSPRTSNPRSCPQHVLPTVKKINPSSFGLCGRHWLFKGKPGLYPPLDSLPHVRTRPARQGGRSGLLQTCTPESDRSRSDTSCIGPVPGGIRPRSQTGPCNIKRQGEHKPRHFLFSYLANWTRFLARIVWHHWVHLTFIASSMEFQRGSFNSLYHLASRLPTLGGFTHETKGGALEKEQDVWSTHPTCLAHAPSVWSTAWHTVPFKKAHSFSIAFFFQVIHWKSNGRTSSYARSVRLNSTPSPSIASKLLCSSITVLPCSSANPIASVSVCCCPLLFRRGWPLVHQHPTEVWVVTRSRIRCQKRMATVECVQGPLSLF